MGLNGVYINDIKFCDIKANIDNNVLKIGLLVRINHIFNEDQYGCPVTDRREFLKQFFK